VIVLLGVALAAFGSADAAPYFADADGRAAVGLYQRHEYGRAAAAIQRWLEHHPRAPEHSRAELLLALAQEHSGAYVEAADRLDALRAHDPLFAAFEAYHAARTAFLAKDLPRALGALDAVPESSTLAPDAMLLRGDVLHAQARTEDVERLYAKYLDRYPKGIRLPEVTFRLAEAREQLHKPASDLYMKVWIAAPLDWGVQAVAHLDHPEQKATATEWIARAMVLFDAMRNVESEQAFAAALAAPGLDAEATCVARFHRAQSVFKQRNRTRAAPLYEEAVAACAPTKNEDLKAKALYQLGRCQHNIGQYEPAVVTYLKVEEQFPRHSYADDARLRAAEAMAETNDADPRIDETLRALPDRYPDGDMKQEALFRLAFRAWRRGDAEDALRWLDEALRRVPREDIWYAEGRSYYWKGRVLEKLGRVDEALAAWEASARGYPLSYYALVSLNRIRERAPVRAAKITKSLEDPRASTTWSFAARPLFEDDGFRRGVELSRMGLGDDARREFAAVGIQAVGKTKIDDPERRDLLWLTALLLDRAGVWQKSHWIARHALEDDWHRDWPRGAAYKKWLLAYPRGFADLIEPAARAAGYPEALLYAVVREESAFDPIDESFANAIGLLQMIIPTAKRFAEKGETVSRETLRDPTYNVKVGLRWLMFLWDLFGHNPALAVAGHNAGEGAVGRWLRERGTLPFDEWVELIPYDETRNYTKRVMATYFAYRWLGAKPGAERVPVLGQKLPSATGSKQTRRTARARRDKHK
jgi:soluble lytic murein transglycosylase